MAHGQETGSGKPALRQALQARGLELDLIFGLPSGPAACDTDSGCLGRDVWLGPPVEVCAGFELIAVENATALGDDVLKIGEGLEAQVIRHMRHGSPPRLMALQPIRVPNPGKS